MSSFFLFHPFFAVSENKGYITHLSAGFTLAPACLPDLPEIFDDEHVSVKSEYADPWLEKLQYVLSIIAFH